MSGSSYRTWLAGTCPGGTMRDCFDDEPQWIDGYIDRWDSFYAHPPAFVTEDPEAKKPA